MYVYRVWSAVLNACGNLVKKLCMFFLKNPMSLAFLRVIVSSLIWVPRTHGMNFTGKACLISILLLDVFEQGFTELSLFI